MQPTRVPSCQKLPIHLFGYRPELPIRVAVVQRSSSIPSFVSLLSPCSSFQTLVAEASDEETAAREKAEAEEAAARAAAAAAEAEAAAAEAEAEAEAAAAAAAAEAAQKEAEKKERQQKDAAELKAKREEKAEAEAAAAEKAAVEKAAAEAEAAEIKRKEEAAAAEKAAAAAEAAKVRPGLALEFNQMCQSPHSGAIVLSRPIFCTWAGTHLPSTAPPFFAVCFSFPCHQKRSLEGDAAGDTLSSLRPSQAPGRGQRGSFMVSNKQASQSVKDLLGKVGAPDMRYIYLFGGRIACAY